MEEPRRFISEEHCLKILEAPAYGLVTLWHRPITSALRHLGLISDGRSLCPYPFRFRNNRVGIRRVVYRRQTRSNFRTRHYTLIDTQRSHAHFQQQFFFLPVSYIERAQCSFFAQLIFSLKINSFSQGDHKIHPKPHYYQDILCIIPY